MTRVFSKEEQIINLLNGLGNKISPKFERCTGISSSRFEILHELDQVDEINQSMLQKIINIDSAAITRHLKQLEADSMVTRRKNPEDNRVTFVRLTDEGRKQIEGYKVEKTNFINQILQDFSEEEVHLLADFLERMQNNF
ncbi:MULTISPECIES: MarR family winged helix-turn-helix transcriptional regulator [Paenibacillus]|uniref:MarR family winged helix-turn-helix transcriptional regulator n=1 Tax=Paenibacillus TaxID=44249 RepID=UPI0007BEF3EA|nr:MULTISPECIES: MarR family transcriptional regulator [Paenibacillus]MCZ1267574.1 MarR family transcriptional regulator [Paenibacillus tundrae]OAX49879.1 Multiple antibiotic resistance protein MarR [Paenibacillus sp. AD87]WDQ35465.1 MarR family transcriptional regulator [Paenibacillus marchantiae]SDL92010.1 DNA-binding transcriptional regulator, MarR family [Paenibacillus sp. OK060]SEB28541.1 DNA-binding transcriptional regulator, MarR family [Paenibacillus sp. 276b]